MKECLLCDRTLLDGVFTSCCKRRHEEQNRTKKTEAIGIHRKEEEYFAAFVCFTLLRVRVAIDMGDRFGPKKTNNFCEKKHLHWKKTAELFVSATISSCIERKIVAFSISFESAVQVHADEFQNQLVYAHT